MPDIAIKWLTIPINPKNADAHHNIAAQHPTHSIIQIMQINFFSQFVPLRKFMIKMLFTGEIFMLNWVDLSY